MYKKCVLILVSLFILLFVTACFNETNKKEDEKELICKEFLLSYYVVTEKDLDQFSNRMELIQQGEYDKYATELKDQYTNMLSSEEIDRLIANKHLDRMSQIADEYDTQFDVKDISLTMTHEEDSYVIYDYAIELINKNDVQNAFNVNGEIRIDRENDQYLITHTQLNVPDLK